MLRVLMGRFLPGRYVLCMAVRPRESPQEFVLNPCLRANLGLTLETDKHSAFVLYTLRADAPREPRLRGAERRTGDGERETTHTRHVRRGSCARRRETRATARGHLRCETLRSPSSSSRSSQAYDSQFALDHAILMNNNFVSSLMSSCKLDRLTSRPYLCIAQRRRRVLGARWRVIARLQPG